MRVVVCALDSPGVAAPVAEIGAELARRGHAVVAVTGHAAAPLFADHGIARHPRPAGDKPSFTPWNWSDPVAAVIQYLHVRDAVRAHGADVVLTSALANGPLLAARDEDLPVAVVGFAGFLWPVGPAGRDRDALARLREFQLAEATRFLAAAAEASGVTVPAARWDANPSMGDVYLQRSCPALDPASAGAFDGRLVHVGALAPRAADVDGWNGWADDTAAPVLYAQAARTFGGPPLWPSLAALARAGWAIAVDTGRAEVPWEDVPPRVRCAQVVPWSLVGRAHAAVTNATTTGVLAALSAGVPSVVQPHGSEQPVLAELLVRAGAATSVPVDTVLTDAMIRTVLDDGAMLATVQRFAAELAAIDGRSVAATALEALA